MIMQNIYAALILSAFLIMIVFIIKEGNKADIIMEKKSKILGIKKVSQKLILKDWYLFGLLLVVQVVYKEGVKVKYFIRDNKVKTNYRFLFKRYKKI